MSDLRTAAIEAAEDALHEMHSHEVPLPRDDYWHAVARSAVDAVLPLLVAETASRIADEIARAIMATPNEWTSQDCRAVFSQSRHKFAAIARRVGETS